MTVLHFSSWVCRSCVYVKSSVNIWGGFISFLIGFNYITFYSLACVLTRWYTVNMVGYVVALSVKFSVKYYYQAFTHHTYTHAHLLWATGKGMKPPVRRENAVKLSSQWPCSVSETCAPLFIVSLTPYLGCFMMNNSKLWMKGMQMFLLKTTRRDVNKCK